MLDCGGTFDSCNQNGGPDFTSGDLFIQVEFDPDGNGDFTEGEIFNPRRELTAVPYAFNAKNAESLGGSSADAFLRTDNPEFFWDNTAKALGIGHSAPASQLHTYMSSTDTLETANGPAIIIEQAGSGDAGIQFELTSGQIFSIGIDNSSTNDDFVVFDGNTARMTINGSTGNVSVAQALFVGTSGGALTTAIDASAVNIDNALDIGANNIVTAATTLSSTEIDLLDGGITLDELTNSGTLTAGTVDINGGSIDGVVIGASTASTGAFTTLSLSDDITWSATTPRITINATEAITITDGTDSFIVNTSGSFFSFSDGTNSFTFDVDSGPIYAGSARPQKTIVLSPEYAGAVLTPFYGAGTDTSTTGTMTSDVEITGANELRTYYHWERTSSTQHFYTVAVRVTLPSDFAAWADTNALQVEYQTENATSTNSDLDVRVYLESNSTTAVASSVDNVSTSWGAVTIDDSVLNDESAPEWDEAGETAVIYLRMGSQSGNHVRVGDIRLNYLAKY